MEQPNERVGGQPAGAVGENSTDDSFKRRIRGLELTIRNKTEKITLKFEKEYFNSGTWFRMFRSIQILPDESSRALVANRSGALTGVSGGLMFTFESNTKKYLIIGFTNPLIGCYKTYISISDVDLGPENGYANAINDQHKHEVIGGFVVEAIITDPEEGGNKQMIFTISDTF